MIAKLTGVIDEIGADHLIIMVGGVGYAVQASSRTLSAIGGRGDAVTIHTVMQVSENDMRLIGFVSGEERDGFRLLTGVQGVGGKVALAILSALTPAELHRAVVSGDKAMVARAQGVGPKLALRIVNELKDKIGALAGIGGGGVVLAGAGAALATDGAGGGHAADALSALTGLGFKPAEAQRAVAEALTEAGEGASLDTLVRLALRRVGK